MVYLRKGMKFQDLVDRRDLEVMILMPKIIKGSIVCLGKIMKFWGLIDRKDLK